MRDAFYLSPMISSLIGRITCVCRRLLVALLAMSALFGASLAVAGPEAELWARWTEHDANSAVVVDHSSWDRLTRQHLSRGGNGVALLDYSGFDAADRRSLADYIGALQATPVSQLNRSEQYAYWLNLYNAATVAIVLQHYPVRSIRDIDISPGLFANGPWGATLLSVEGEELSLDDIEHRILRPIWQDPRIHYGVNCASIGCPDLRAGAFTGENVDSALDEAARAYVNHPRGARVNRGRLVVSSIYNWFEEDFGGNDSGVIGHLMRFAEPGLAAQLQGISRVSDDEYDWTLNDANPAPAASDVRRRNQFNGSGGGRGS
ncbi:MAG: DUF547 domain-containing protein [Pseudomonadota bacterium]